jgi:peptidoglycan/xylan/chitin deacetylase (PgdA/CDA1 family)
MSEVISNVADGGKPVPDDDKMTVGDALGGSRMNVDVKEFLADWIEKNLGRNCRDVDGKIDLYNKDYDDLYGDNADMIVAALLPFVIDIYDWQYRGNGTAWLRQKTMLIDRHMEEGDYDHAHLCMADTTCVGPGWREWTLT